MIRVLALSLVVVAWEVPAAPSGHVNDYARILSLQTVSGLEQMLSDHERQTTNQIVVVTVPTLDERSIEDASFAIAERWGIGRARRDNGVLFVVAPAEKRMRIEVGKGLEGALTDLQSHVILDEIVRPAFAENDFDRGVRDGARAIIQAIQGEFRAPSADRWPGESGSPSLHLGMLLLLLLLFLFFPRAGMLLLLAGGGRAGRRGFSGGGGRFGGGGASGRW